MLGFKSVNSARAILGGIEMVHMMRKGAGEVCLESAALACRAIRAARCMSAAQYICCFLVCVPELRQNRQARAAGAAGPGRPLLHRAVRALPALRAGAGGHARRDVRPGRLHPQGQGDHRGAVRPQLLGLGDLGHQQAPRRQPGPVRLAPARGAVPVPDPGCPLREGARGRHRRLAGGADRGGHRLGRPAPDPGRRDGQPGKPLRRGEPFCWACASAGSQASSWWWRTIMPA